MACPPCRPETGREYNDAALDAEFVESHGLEIESTTVYEIVMDGLGGGRKSDHDPGCADPLDHQANARAGLENHQKMKMEEGVGDAPGMMSYVDVRLGTLNEPFPKRSEMSLVGGEELHPRKMLAVVAFWLLKIKGRLVN